MFIQVIQARVRDAEGLGTALKRWETDLKPGAKGWLGATSGITKDNEFVAVVRFDNEQNAQANGHRPEQDAWWKELSKNFAGEATFFDSTEVDSFGEGGSDKAGFVQIITGKAKNKKRMKELDEQMSAQQPRPDVIGGTTAWNGDKFFTTVYFTSEKEARENEAKGFEGDAKALMEEMMSLMQDVRFLDLSTPKLESP